MSKNVASYEEFCKTGTHELVKKHYSGATTKVDDLSDPKDSIEKGSGKVDHTEKINSDDLGDPKNANESYVLQFSSFISESVNYSEMSIKDLEELYNSLTSSPEDQKKNKETIEEIEKELSKRK